MSRKAVSGWPKLFLLVGAVTMIGASTQLAYGGVVTMGIPQAAPTTFTFPNGFRYTSTNTYHPVDVYRAPGGFGVAFLFPPVPIDQPLGGVGAAGALNFLGVLQQTFPTPLLGCLPNATVFCFVAGNNLANNSLIVTAYDVKGSANYVGIRDGANGANGRFAGFSVQIANGKAPAGNIHWIQVINDNHNVTNNRGHGNGENIIDTNVPTLPYYDGPGNTGFAAGSSTFLDPPNRSDGTSSHYWIADLYLATGPANFAPGQVTIYNGMLWGWGNLFFPVGNNIARLITGINGATSSVGSFETAVGDLPGSNFQDFSDFLDSSELAEIDQLADAQVLTLAEPSTLALVGTGLVGLASWVRGRRLDRA
jgi:hypothetical protein